jgi:transposase
MAYNFREYNQDQLFLLTPSINDWLPENHLARFVGESIDVIDLQNFYVAYNASGEGNAAYHPQLMIKVLLYAYCLGVTSSRLIARACEDQVGFRYLSMNQQPNFRTIASFRDIHQEELKKLFVTILKMCKEAGLVKMGTVALDGTKLKANAALEANRTIDGIEKEVDRMLAEAKKTDEQEDKHYGKDKRGDELPAELEKKETRLNKLREAKARLEKVRSEAEQVRIEETKQRAAEEEASGEKKRGRKPDPDKEIKEPKTNLTDKDSRIMKTRQGYVQGYNAQAAVDCETQIIVGQAITQDCNDKKQLAPMLKKIKEQSGAVAEEVLADAGYCSESNMLLESKKTELFIAVAKEWKTKKAQRELLPPRGRIPQGTTRVQLMERKLLTKKGREKYKLRSKTVEPVFGQMKSGRGLTTLRLRGKDGAELEWSLWCSTHNLLKLWRWTIKNNSKN